MTSDARKWHRVQAQNPPQGWKPNPLAEEWAFDSNGEVVVGKTKEKEQSTQRTTQTELERGFFD